MLLDRKLWREMGRPELVVMFNDKLFEFGKMYSWETIDEEKGEMVCLCLKDYVCGKRMPTVTFKGKLKILVI